MLLRNPLRICWSNPRHTLVDDFDSRSASLRGSGSNFPLHLRPPQLRNPSNMSENSGRDASLYSSSLMSWTPHWFWTPLRIKYTTCYTSFTGFCTFLNTFNLPLINWFRLLRHCIVRYLAIGRSALNVPCKLHTFLDNTVYFTLSFFLSFVIEGLCNRKDTMIYWTNALHANKQQF